MTAGAAEQLLAGVPRPGPDGTGPEVPGAPFDAVPATIGAPTSLEVIGMPADCSEETARRVVEAAADVRPVEKDVIRQEPDDAFHGRRPA